MELAVKSADYIFVSTPDLLSIVSEAEWLPNPVDTELFHPEVKPETVNSPIVPHSSMPSYLKAKRVHKENMPWGLRKQSLEMLAVGGNVEWNGLVIRTLLPEQHEPEFVAERTIDIYKAILDGVMMNVG